jgi:hypothetical protein
VQGLCLHGAEAQAEHAGQRNGLKGCCEFHYRPISLWNSSRFSNWPPLTSGSSFFFAAGPGPGEQDGGRYYANPSTDKQKIDLNVIWRSIVNILNSACWEA